MVYRKDTTLDDARGTGSNGRGHLAVRTTARPPRRGMPLKPEPVTAHGAGRWDGDIYIPGCATTSDLEPDGEGRCGPSPWRASTAAARAAFWKSVTCSGPLFSS